MLMGNLSEKPLFARRVKRFDPKFDFFSKRAHQWNERLCRRIVSLIIAATKYARKVYVIENIYFNKT